MFTLKINCGNDAMLSLADVSRALLDLAGKLESSTDLIPDHGKLFDTNGNRVGHWTYTPPRV